jgi:hypothetical protein
MWFCKKKKETMPMTNNMSDTIFAAHPGYALLRFAFVDRKATVDFVRSEMKILPILGWRIVDGVTLPIALGDVQAPADGCDAVLCPSGMIHNIAGKAWKGLPAYEVDVLAAWSAWRAARPKEAPPVSRIVHPGDIIGGNMRRSGFIEADTTAA